MSTTNTTNMSLGKPTDGNSYNVWGIELNTIMDILDNAIMSNNFSENSSSHDGLNFYYKNGRTINGITVTKTSGSYITLTDNTTNYIEVDLDGTVSANTTGFTAGQIPLFTVLTASGVIGTVTDKRCYLNISSSQLFTINSDSINTIYNMVLGTGTKLSWKSATYEYIQLSGSNSLAYTKTAAIDSKLFISNNVYYDSGNSRWEYISTDEASQLVMEDGSIKLKTLESGTAGDEAVLLDGAVIDKSQNILINGATAETVSQGAITVKQGTEPTTSSADQISIFATAGANSTLGLRTEQAESNNKLRYKINGTEKYLYGRTSSLDPVSSFISTPVSIVNTTSETDILTTLTVPGQANPGGQIFRIQLATEITTASAAHQITVYFKCGGSSSSIYSNTSSTLSSSKGWIFVTFYCLDDSTTGYSLRASFGGYTFSGAGNFAQDWTSDVDIDVTGQWNTADAGSQIDVLSGFIEVLR